jgi:hypothetical protein
MMKSAVALACAAWLNVPGAHPPNTAPLAFGMTPQEVANALGTSLTPVSGRRGSEIFSAMQPARIPGFYPAETRLYLQFRHGCLTGWKKDWRMLPRHIF